MAARPSSGKLGKLSLHQLVRKPCTSHHLYRHSTIGFIFHLCPWPSVNWFCPFSNRKGRAFGCRVPPHLREIPPVFLQLRVVRDVQHHALSVQTQRAASLLLRAQIAGVYKRRLQEICGETLLQPSSECLHLGVIVPVRMLGAGGRGREREKQKPSYYTHYMTVWNSCNQGGLAD